MRNFENRLKGGHPNSLGNTIEIVEEVLQEHGLFNELFNCYYSNDEVVRLRTSNAMKRIARVEKHLLIPYLDQFIAEIAGIDQASTQWTLSQLFDMYSQEMSKEQYIKALAIMKNNLENHNDWIVLNTTMDTLVKWAEKEEELKEWLIPNLKRLANDHRKSVFTKANKILIRFSDKV